MKAVQFFAREGGSKVRVEGANQRHDLILHDIRNSVIGRSVPMS